MMGTGFSKNKVKRSPMKKGRKDHTLSSKKRKLHSKPKNFGNENTRIYSRLEDEEFEMGSVNMQNTKSELSVKSTKTHKNPLTRNQDNRMKSPFTKGTHVNLPI
jgi:oligoendopeptidase F